MNKKIGILALVAPLAFAAFQAQAADTVASGSATASSSATIIRPVTVAKTQDLAFGTIIRPSTGSTTYTIPTSGGANRSVSGSDGLFLASGNSTNAAFTVTGEGSYSIAVSVPSTFTLTDGTTSLTVNTSIDKSGNQTLSSTLGNAGTLDVKVGGDVTVASTTSTGNYSGSVTVTATYN